MCRRLLDTVKNQYFGDLSDYRKFGLLRAMAGAGVRIGVDWMLTADDGGRDGRRITYLDQPDRWRGLDPDLFDFLAGKVSRNARGQVTAVESAGLIPEARYHADMLTDERAGRVCHLEAALARFQDLDLIFFDPDNGLEVPSCPIGRKGSSKFLALAEARCCYEAGLSLLVFQHFGRVSRARFIPAQMERLGQAVGPAHVLALATPHVLYLFALQARHLAGVTPVIEAFGRRWGFHLHSRGDERRFLAESSG